MCRMCGLDVKADRTVKYSDTTCTVCKDQYKIETQCTQCHAKCLQNTMIKYIPVYMDLFNDDIQEQIYTSIVVFENMRI